MRWDDLGTIGGSGNTTKPVAAPSGATYPSSVETPKNEGKDCTSELIKVSCLKKPVIIIINGKGGCGKDTLIQHLSSEFYPITLSTVDIVKKAATLLGYNMNDKSNEGRKFLHDIKMASQIYNDFPNRHVVHTVNRLCTAFKEITAIEEIRLMGHSSEVDAILTDVILRNKMLQYMFPDIIVGPSNVTTDPNAFFKPVIFIHCREPESITSLLNMLEHNPTIKTLAFPPKTLIVRRSETDNKTYGNHCDDDVELFKYDYMIDNEDLQTAVKSLEQVIENIRVIDA